MAREFRATAAAQPVHRTVAEERVVQFRLEQQMKVGAVDEP